MIGLLGETEREERFEKNLAQALLECLLEVSELIPYACVVLLFVGGAWIVGDMVYQLMIDPNALGVASRLDAVSIDPNKWFPRS
jgi:hypothetical protein